MQRQNRRCNTKRQSIYTLFSCALLLTLLSACQHRQTAFHNEKQSLPSFQAVQVMTPGVMGAECYLQAQGGVYRVKAPGRVNVQRGAAPMKVSCAKGDHFRGYKTVASRAVVEEGSTVNYIYPNSISVAMRLNNNSLKPRSEG